MSTTIPDATAARLAHASRAAAAAALVGLAVVVMTAWSASYRHLEAELTGVSSALFTHTLVYQQYWLLWHDHTPMAFDVTRQCSSNLMVSPLLLLAALGTLLRGRIGLLRVLLGLLAGVATCVVLNTVRLDIIGLAYGHWGTDSHWLTHDLLGSLITVAASLLAVVVQVVVAGVHRSPRARRSFPEDGSRPSRHRLRG